MPGLLSRNKLLLLIWSSGIVYGCERKDIEFGTVPENTYTELVYTDTVNINISTIVTDSFATNGNTVFLVGRYTDPYLGTVSGKAFLQMTVPSSIPEIPSTAKFDSLTLLIHPNKYYYGDTSKTQTIYVHELVNAISYSYNSHLYNTSDVPVKLIALGTKTLRINPTGSDSISIRLQDEKGQELYSRLQQSATEVSVKDDFLNYFHGLSISTADGDNTAVYGLSGTEASIVMRVHYHTNIPYPEAHYIDFTSLANDLSFNQLLTNRAGTGIVTGPNGLTELPSASTDNFAFMQTGTGLYLKMIFPSLGNILTNENIVKLLKADLIIRPGYLSFDKDKYLLPSQLYLTQTDASNIPGSNILDSTGASTLYASPIVDDIYGENTHYRFNVTSYINQLLNTAGSSNAGLYIMQKSALSELNVDRLIVNNQSHNSLHSQLLLSLMVIKR